MISYFDMYFDSFLSLSDLIANVAAMYYGYCMLPDGTYCLAPPPPGIDANGYYSSLPSGRMLAPPSYSGTPPPPGTTPPAPPEPSTRIIYTAPPTTFPIIPPPTPVPSQVPVCLSTPSPPAPVIPAAVIPETRYVDTYWTEVEIFYHSSYYLVPPHNVMHC